MSTLNKIQELDGFVSQWYIDVLNVQTKELIGGVELEKLLPISFESAQSLYGSFRNAANAAYDLLDRPDLKFPGPLGDVGELGAIQIPVAVALVAMAAAALLGVIYLFYEKSRRYQVFDQIAEFAESDTDPKKIGQMMELATELYGVKSKWWTYPVFGLATLGAYHVAIETNLIKGAKR